MGDLLIPSLVGLALLFAFVNGFQEGSNVVATGVLSRSVRPGTALMVTAVAEVLGAVFLGSAVADTLGRDLLDPVFFHPAKRTASVLVLFSALGAAFTWNVMTWWVGMPPGSSHALIGGLLGGAVAMGFDVIQWPVLVKLLVVLLSAPIAGGLIGRLAIAGSSLLSAAARLSLGEFCRRNHWLSLLLLGAGHGSNNAPKAAGLITMALVVSGSLVTFAIPLWVGVGCGLAMGLGVYAGGWDIVKILGNRVFRIGPGHSFLSQGLTGGVLLAASLAGCPVGGVEVIKSTVMGVGAGRRGGGVRWLVFREIVLAWTVTIPATAILAAALYWTASGALGEDMGSLEVLLRSVGI